MSLVPQRYQSFQFKVSIIEAERDIIVGDGIEVRKVFVFVKFRIWILIFCNIEGQEIILFVRLLNKVNPIERQKSWNYLETQGHCGILGVIQGQKFLKINNQDLELVGSLSCLIVSVGVTSVPKIGHQALMDPWQGITLSLTLSDLTSEMQTQNSKYSRGTLQRWLQCHVPWLTVRNEIIATTSPISGLFSNIVLQA